MHGGERALLTDYIAKAKPLFSGHYQPHIPADLGFYDGAHWGTSGPQV